MQSLDRMGDLHRYVFYPSSMIPGIRAAVSADSKEQH